MSRPRLLPLSCLVAALLLALVPATLQAGSRKGPVEVLAETQFQTSVPGGFNELRYVVHNRSKNKTIEVEVRAGALYSDGFEDVLSQPTFTLEPGQGFEVFVFHLVLDDTVAGPAVHFVEATATVLDRKGKGPKPFDVEDADLFEVVE